VLVCPLTTDWSDNSVRKKRSNFSQNLIEDEEIECDVSFYFLPEQFAKDPEIALLRERAERVRRQALLAS
jgi:hypothetical protein